MPDEENDENLEKKVEEPKLGRNYNAPSYYPTREEEERRRRAVYDHWHTGNSKLGWEEEERRRKNAFNRWYG